MTDAALGRWTDKLNSLLQDTTEKLHPIAEEIERRKEQLRSAEIVEAERPAKYQELLEAEKRRRDLMSPVMRLYELFFDTKPLSQYKRELRQYNDFEYPTMMSGKRTPGTYLPQLSLDRLAERRQRILEDISEIESSLEQAGREVARRQEDVARAAAKDQAFSKARALAAAHLGEIRKQAKTVRRRIAAEIGSEIDSEGRCPYCEDDLGETPHADHIVPVARGGLSTDDNMVLVCATCNNRKGELTLREFTLKYNLDRDRIEAELERLGKRF